VNQPQVLIFEVTPLKTSCDNPEAEILIVGFFSDLIAMMSSLANAGRMRKKRRMIAFFH